MATGFPYALTAHAAKVIAEREIPLTWVAHVLERPMKTEADRNDPALRHALARIPEQGDKVLRVVYNITTTPWLVVTAYFDRKLRGKV